MLESLNPGQFEKCGTVKDGFEFRHGVIPVHVTVAKDTYTISAPCAAIGDSHMAEQGLGTAIAFQGKDMMLAQFVVRDGELWTFYSGRLDSANLQKSFGVLKDVAYVADYEARRLPLKFRFESLQKDFSRPYAPDVLESLFEQFQSFLKEGEAYADYFANNGKAELAASMLKSQAEKALHHVQATGLLRANLLNNVLATLSDFSAPASLRLDKGRDDYFHLKDMDLGEFGASVRNEELLLPASLAMTFDVLCDRLTPILQEAEEKKKSGNFEEVFVLISSHLSEILCRGVLEPDHHETVISLLEKSSGKPWEVASKSLLQDLQSFLQTS